MSSTTLLIVGAGPFGLAAAGRCIERGIPYVVVGRPFAFWRDSMPDGMLLRSSYDWHLCSEGKFTFEAYLHHAGLERKEPIALNRFLDYGAWYMRNRGVQVHEGLVSQIRGDHSGKPFLALTESGEEIEAEYLLCTPGLGYFQNVPEGLSELVAPQHWSHSADIDSCASFAGKRCLIVGGRQSAFELAALLGEHGARSVTVVLRHAVPQFTESDWSWVMNDLQASEASPGWFARLSEERRTAIGRRFWEEGRLRLEPWLAPRLRANAVEVIPESEIESVKQIGEEKYRAHLSGGDGRELEFDRLILATGFSVNLGRVPYLGTLLQRIDQVGGFPSLTERFESRSLPGLFLTGFVAAQDFGPYMGFLASCPFAARTAVDAIASRAENAQSPS